MLSCIDVDQIGFFEGISQEKNRVVQNIPIQQTCFVDDTRCLNKLISRHIFLHGIGRTVIVQFEFVVVEQIVHFEEWIEEKKQRGYVNILKDKFGVRHAGDCLATVYHVFMHMLEGGDKRTKGSTAKGPIMTDDVSYESLNDICMRQYCRRLIVIQTNQRRTEDDVIYMGNTNNNGEKRKCVFCEKMWTVLIMLQRNCTCSHHVE